jgi:hypothetical protein
LNTSNGRLGQIEQTHPFIALPWNYYGWSEILKLLAAIEDIQMDSRLLAVQQKTANLYRRVILPRR